MAINYPTSLDTLTNPTATDQVATVDHASQHSELNDIAEALQAKVGINASTPTDNKVLRGTGTGASDWGQIDTGDIAAANLTGADTKLVTGTEGALDTLSVWNTDGDLVAATVNADTPIAISGADITIDGDKLDIDWTPTNYTPDATPSEADDVDDLTAHLKGIDTAIAGAGAAIVTTYQGQAMMPLFNSSATNKQLATNTTQQCFMFILPYKIVVTSINLSASVVGTAGTYDIVIYSEDGQTQEISVTTGSISATGLVETAVSSVTLNPGNYYFTLTPNGTADVSFRAYAGGTADDALNEISGENTLAGYLTVSAGAPAATFDPTSDLTADNDFIKFRLD